MPPKKKVKKEAAGAAAAAAAAPASSSSSSSPSRGRRGAVKEEEDAVPPAAVKSEDAAVVPDAPPSSRSLKVKSEEPSEDEATKLYEFKFVSVAGDESAPGFGDNELEGRFHTPLLIDPVSGILSVVPGTTSGDVKGFMNWKVEGGLTLEDKFEAKIEYRPYGNYHVLRLGYAQEGKRVKKADDLEGAVDTHEFVSVTTMERFAANAGGELVFRNHAGDGFSLYTVISELRPGQAEPTVTAASAKTKEKPDWERLEALARNNRTFQNFDIKGGIAEYKRFLALKLSRKDETSEKYAPSRDVDRLWHIHLSFPEQYQEDVLAFGKEVAGRGAKNQPPFVVPHCPFLNEESKERYIATLAAIIGDKKLDKIVGKKVNRAFWPDAAEMFPEDEEVGVYDCGGCC